MLAVLRRPEGLFRLDVERATPFQPPAPGAPLDGVGGYVETVRPFDPAAAFYGEAIRASIATLRDERTAAGPEMLAAILHILVASVPDPGAFDVGFTRPLVEPDRAPPRPTAANPRAYRGTKRRPPKRSRARRVDALPALDGGPREAALLAQLAEHLDAAVARVTRDAAYGENLAELGRGALRPFGQCWRDAVTARVVAAQPPEFRRTLLWSARGVSPGHLAALVAAYWALDLERDVPLRRLVARIVGPAEASVRWVRALETVAPRRRLALAELLLETGVASGGREPPLEALDRAEELCDDLGYRHRMYALLRAIRSGIPPASLLEGFEIANDYEPDARFDEPCPLAGVLPAVRAAMTVIGQAEDSWAGTGFAVELWERCGRLEGLADLLGELPWPTLDPDSAFGLARVLTALVFSDLEGFDRSRKWATIRGHAGRAITVLSQLEARFRRKAIGHLDDVCWEWDEPGTLRRALDRLLSLLPRIGRDPIPARAGGGSVLSVLASLEDAAWSRVASAPDVSFVRLSNECRRSNDEALIARGLRSLARFQDALAARAFSGAPGPLLAAAKSLGALRAPARETLLAREGAMPLFLARPEELDASALVELLDASASGLATTLVSRRLRAHLRGDQALRDGQVERVRRRILAAWDPVLLARLAVAVEEDLARGAGVPLPSTERERHALLFQSSAFEHRRALRRLLKARSRGDGAHPDSHPRNVRWLAAHPAIDAGTWTHGIVLRREIPGAGEVTLAFERDPLEVLRLGTYVGSCLSLGGGQAYSAVAIALDVNKQVVYGRDGSGGVLARQVLALSERDRLFCFEVYPLEAPAEVRALFLEYDRELARALGIAIHDPEAEKEDDGEIALLLSSDWWFDYPISPGEP